jgi:hypothetical protein
MIDYWTQKDKARITFDIIFGLLLAVVCGGMIFLGKRALKQTKNVNNVSINVINSWIYNLMNFGLFLQIIVNVFIAIV